MGFSELASRTTIANIVAAGLLVLVAAWAAWIGDTQLLRDLAFLAAGYLFGVTAPRGGSGGG